MAERGAAIPQAQTDDNEDISWALSTAEAMWSRGDLIDAIKWVRRAAEAAGDAEQDERALELAKAAAELQNQVGGVREQPGSEPAPPPPLPAAMAAAHSAVTAPPPDGASEPPPAAMASPVPPAAAVTASPPRVAPSVPPPAPGASFAAGGRGPTSTAPKRPSVIPRASGTPAPPAVARVSSPRPPLPRSSGAPLPPAPPLPPGAAGSSNGPPPVPTAAPAAPSSATALPSITPQYVPHLPPVAPVSSMPATARAIEVAIPAAPGSVPPAPGSSRPSVDARNDDDATATSHDLEPPEDTAQIDVPVAPRRNSSKAPPPPTAPRPQLDTPSTSIDGRQLTAQTTELRALRHPSIAEEIDAWPTQAISGEEFAESNVGALVAALPPMRPREPSKHPMDPELLATQAVRVVVWRTPDGVRVAPAGTVVSAIACDAVLVALDPTADLSAWLTNKR